MSDLIITFRCASDRPSIGLLELNFKTGFIVQFTSFTNLNSISHHQPKYHINIGVPHHSFLKGEVFMTVAACCRESVVTVTGDISVLRVAELMQDMNVGSVVVTDDGERPIGILTDRDLVLRIIIQRKDPEKTAVSNVMTKDPVVLEGEMGLYKALEYIRMKGIRRLPVVDTDGKLSGIVTIDDIIRILAEELQCIATIIEEES
jgi:signal-transduction protein with cAMP-binding, CBS, and nucleotidyltransferase domain